MIDFLVHIFRGLPQVSNLEIMDNARPIHGDPIDDSPFHEVDQDGTQAHLHDVGSHSSEDEPMGPVGL